MELKKIYDKIDKILNLEDKDPIITLKAIQKEIEIEIITNGKPNKTITSTFKEFRKLNEDKPKFQQVIHKNNINVLCNGFYLIEYTDEQLPAELKPYKMEDANSSITYDRMHNSDTPKSAIINLQDVNKLLKYNKLHKKDQISFVVNNEYFLDAKYIIQVANFLKIKDNITIRYGSDIAPCNIITKNGKALILPLRTRDEAAINAIQKFNEIMN